MKIIKIGLFIVGTMIISQFLEKIIAIMRLDLMIIIYKILKNQKNQKVKNLLSLKNSLSQENQKVKNWKTC